MGLGSILMLAILGRYIYSRRNLLNFDAGQGASTDPESQTNSSNAESRYSRFTKARRTRAMYDSWLMTRFTVAFFFLWYVACKETQPHSLMRRAVYFKRQPHSSSNCQLATLTNAWLSPSPISASKRPARHFCCSFLAIFQELDYSWCLGPRPLFAGTCTTSMLLWSIG
jgi:hypothetical protein